MGTDQTIVIKFGKEPFVCKQGVGWVILWHCTKNFIRITFMIVRCARYVETILVTVGFIVKQMEVVRRW